VLLVLFLGYMAFRRIPTDPLIRAKRCSILALIAALDVPIVLFSVQWWQTLHQTESILGPSHTIQVHGSMGVTLLLGFLSMSLIFLWMVMVRYEIEKLNDEIGGQDFAISLTERKREGELVGASEAKP
jgi:heme exporter protein C